MTDILLKIWPVPAGHKSGFVSDSPALALKLDLLDLINAGVISPGTQLYPRTPKYAERVGTLLADGRIELAGKQYDSLSQAATFLTGNATNGWWFFLVDRATRRSLKHVRRDYANRMSVEGEYEEGGDEDDDDEA
jgi:hypothetical protein